MVNSDLKLGNKVRYNLKQDRKVRFKLDKKERSTVELDTRVILLLDKKVRFLVKFIKQGYLNKKVKSNETLDKII